MENLESKIHTQQNHAQIDWFGILKLGIRYESDNIIGSLKAVIFISHIPRMHYFFHQSDSVRSVVSRSFEKFGGPKLFLIPKGVFGLYIQTTIFSF